MLTPGAWPILDHDDDPDDLISGLLWGGTKVELPSRAVLAILGSKVAAHANAQGWEQIDAVEMITASYPIHLATRDGRELALVEAPVGAPATVMVAEWLVQRGVRTVVAVGSCGALHDFGEGEFMVPTKALRDEGTSHHYLPPSTWVATDPQVSAACSAAIRGRGHSAAEVATWTTDGFFRETRAMIERRKQQGCGVVEMECASLAAWAKFRGVGFGQILFTADSLAGEHYDPRDWGVDSHEVALRIGLDAGFAVED